MLKRFIAVVRDDCGGEVLEYALIAGLTVLAAVAGATASGAQLLARWTSADSHPA